MRQSRDDKKAAKKQKKIEKAQKLSIAILAREPQKKIPISSFPSVEKKPIDFGSRSDFLEKQPKLNSNPSVYNSPMTWCARISDTKGEWSWKETRQWSSEEWDEVMLSKLNQLEGKKWSELAAMTTGEGKRRKSRRKLHHSQEMDTLDKEAQERWKELDLELFDTAFRFRIGGKKRIWGFQLGSHFHLVWYERGHRICPI
ncbi:hypothetical protein WN093_04665 [Gammaproteobacteria bacterium AS21]